MARVRVVMVPGWEKKVLRASDPLVQRVRMRVEAQVIGNIVGGGHVVTGELVGSVRSHRTGIARGRVWIGSDHWWFIEYGTRPHVIRPRSPGGMLRFVSGGQVRYAASVNHPGNREYAVVRRALR